MTKIEEKDLFYFFDKANAIMNNARNISLNNNYLNPYSIFYNDINKIYSAADIVLEIYCQYFDFPQYTLSSLYEKCQDYFLSEYIGDNEFYSNKIPNDIREIDKMDTNPIGKNTSYKYGKIYVHDTFIYMPYFKDTYPGSFMFHSLNTITDRNNINITSYHGALTSKILSNWDNMPFNPRHLRHSAIKTPNYAYYLNLNNWAPTSNKLDRLIFYYLTDHFFNIDLFCQYINIAQHVNVDDTRKRQPYVTHPYMDFFIKLFEALQTLPSSKSKLTFLYVFEEKCNELINSVKEDSADKEDYIYDKFSNLIKLLIVEIYRFSQIDYPVIKNLFAIFLMDHIQCKDICHIKNAIKPYKKDFELFICNNSDYLKFDNTSFPEQLKKDLMKINNNQLNYLSKIFFSNKIPTPIVTLDNITKYCTPTKIAALYKLLDENILDLINRNNK